MFEAEQRRLFNQFEVRKFCDNLVEGVVKALKDVSKIHKKSTSTLAPVTEPSIFISEEPKGDSKNSLEDLKYFSDSLPIFDEYDEELMESLITCEDECDLPSPKPNLMFDIDNEETNELACFEPEHPNSLVLVSQVFEEEPFDYPHQGPRLDTRRPLDDGLGPIFEEEDELCPTFDEKELSMTYINMENHLCFDPGTTPTSLPTDSQEHCKEPDLISFISSFYNTFRFLVRLSPSKQISISLNLAYQNDVPRFVDQSIGANQHGDQDVLNNLTEVRSSDRTDQTDQAIPRASRLEHRLETRPDDQSDQTTARLPRPLRHSKTHGRTRLSLGREETEDGHAFLSGGPSGQSRKRPYLYPVHPSGSEEPGHYLKGHL
ncbi:hypothetical protein F2Q70_00016793 [Brassica cretica]|uniref:Uncharacterized protein n=1 Tax=Brassica cretica TaxID=69181 RepID=A0A8S9HZR8_BRACR|nr:hypothetical protein F2Q70_00016793 [Brassica cretica]